MTAPRALHHVALGAVDVEAVARFYREQLDLPEVGRHFDQRGALRSVWLDTGGVLLMIERADEPRRTVTGVGAGPFLLAFCVAPAERRQLEQRLERAGFAPESRTEFSSYFRDPEGNRVAISHYPQPGA